MAKETNSIQERAAKRADEKMAFIYHFATYVIVNVIILTVNLLTSPDELWSLWAIFGWGIGILVHGLTAFAFGGKFENLRHKWTQEEIENLKKREDK